MKDQYNRNIDYLRLSVTDNCNLRCIYCMHGSDIKFFTEDEKLSDLEILRLVKICAKIGISKIRITGGEPLVRDGIVDLINKINNIEGIREIHLTTNGILLYNMADKLKKSGVKGVNISLDTLDNEKFKLLTKVGDLDKVLKAMYKSLELGLKVKLNTVLIESLNVRELKGFIELTKNNNLDIRFIELMPLGAGMHYEGISNKKLQDIIKTEYKQIEVLSRKELEGPAEYIKIKGYTGRVGFISPISSCFCSECNRIRITADGFMKRCLYEKSNLNLRDVLRSNIDDKALEDIIYSCIYSKPENNEKLNINNNEKRFMNEIGG